MLEQSSDGWCALVVRIAADGALRRPRRGRQASHRCRRCRGSGWHRPSQPKQESGVRTVFGWVGLVGLGEHNPAEGNQREIGRVDQLTNSSYAVALPFCEQRFRQHPSETRSPVVGSHGDDHEIAVLGDWPETLVLDALVSGHRDDFSLILCDDDLTVERMVLDVVAPGDEAETISPTSSSQGDRVSPRSNASRADSSSVVAWRRITSWRC